MVYIHFLQFLTTERDESFKGLSFRHRWKEFNCYFVTKEVLVFKVP